MQIAGRLLALGCLALGVAASEYPIDGDNRPICNGMYSKDAWGGSDDPHIQVTLDMGSWDGQGNPTASYVVYEFKDEDLVGRQMDNGDYKYVCTEDAVQAGLCTQDDINQFVLVQDALKKNTSSLITGSLEFKGAEPVQYPVRKTGYYCAWVVNVEGVKLQGTVEFRNAYGELPAAQIAKLPFYGGLTLAYAVIGIFWGFLYFQNRHDILAVQNYITAILVFLVVEQLTTWGFYDFQNRNGSANIGTKALMVVTAILNAGRNSFSFFLLLIVCMGYGVVKPTLGKTMIYVRMLAVAHFVFGLIYGVGSLSITPDTVGPLVLFIIMPLAATLTAFYVWTLNSLSATMRDLIKRKQTVKALMYKRLWWCILGSILVIFAFFFFNSFTFASRSDPSFVPQHWKTRWFILDGWLNLVYLFDICFVAYLWRPTANNRRFAMSDELAQDEDGTFEIASIDGLSDDDDDDEEAGRAGKRGGGGLEREYPNGIPRHQDPAIDSDDEDEEPMSPVPPMPVHDGRHSHDGGLDDGETLFAVGDDDVDKWSEEGEARDSQEKARLTSHRG